MCAVHLKKTCSSRNVVLLKVQELQQILITPYILYIIWPSSLAQQASHCSLISALPPITHNMNIVALN